MNYLQLREEITEVIRTNGNEEITGEVMQYILLEMVSTLGKDFQFAGVGSPSTDVGEPDENKAWIVPAGHYTNFGNEFDVAENEFGVVMFNGGYVVSKVAVGRLTDSALTEGGTNPVEGGAIYAEFVKLRAAGYLFAGLATRTDTPPAELTEKIFYICTQAGDYTNFDNVTVQKGLNVLMYDGTRWAAHIIFEIGTNPTEASEALIESGGVFAALEGKVDKVEGMGLSEQSFETTEKQKLRDLPTATELTTMLGLKQDVLQWDNAPTQGSTNPVTSAGIYEAIKNFITRAVDDLINYYTKSMVYTKTEVANLIAAIKQFNIVVVDQLPQASENTIGTLYLVPSEAPGVQNVKDEYITLSKQEGGQTVYYWECIGRTEIDLSNYTTFDDANSLIATALQDYYTKAQTDAKIAAAIGTLADMTLVTDKDVILTDTATGISITGGVQVAATSLTLTRGGYLVASGTGTVITAIDNVNLGTAGSFTYLLTAVINGVTRTKEVTVEVKDAVLYGAGTQASSITTKATARKTPAGRYNITATAGDSLFILCPTGMSVQGMRMNGIEVPLEPATGVVVGDKAYLCYQSSNVYDAGTYVIDVY